MNKHQQNEISVTICVRNNAIKPNKSKGSSHKIKKSTRRPHAFELRLIALNKIRKNAKNTKIQNQTKCLKNKKDQNIQDIVCSQNYGCSICLNTMIYPVLTLCGHAFCLPCLEEYLKYKHICPICREIIEFNELKTSSFIAYLIKKAQSKQTEENVKIYRERKMQFQIKQSDIRVNGDVKIGDLVDYCQDWEWHTGRVTDIVTTLFQQQKILTIQTTQNKLSKKIFKISSRLIAKYRKYTQATFQFCNNFFFDTNLLVSYTPLRLIRRTPVFQIPIFASLNLIEPLISQYNIL